MDTWDEKEEERLEGLQQCVPHPTIGFTVPIDSPLFENTPLTLNRLAYRLKSRGKGPPKKKRTALGKKPAGYRDRLPRVRR